MYGIESLLSGRSLGGRYRVGAVIGRGGMGAVYRAKDERLGRAVAVKVVAVPGASPDEQAQLRARFIREAQVAARLRHPNVVDVFDFGTDPELELDYLVMELLEGEDLAARLARSGAPPRRTALAILRQAAKGLAAGHRAGLVHRDVKPGNLFLEAGDHPEEPVVRVLDFGIAQVAADDNAYTKLTEYGRSPYSPAYASPEQLEGEPTLTPASDVFSLAAVGYHLLTGTRCFTASDAGRMEMEVASSVLALEERARGLPAPVRGALARALARRPADRFPDAAAFAGALAGNPGPAAPFSATAGWPPLPGSTPRPDGRDDRTMLAPDQDDSTRLYEVPSPPPAPAMPRPAPPATLFQPAPPSSARPAPSAPGTRMPQPVPAVPMWGVAPPSAPASERTGIPQPPAEAGAIRRLGRALADFVATLAIMAGFVGCWVLAAEGVVHHDSLHVRLGAAASILFTPLAIHRLTGRTGRPKLLVFGAILATIVAMRLLDGADTAVRLGGIFGMQVVMSFLLTTIFPRRKPKPKPALNL
jgi:serine/threonine protein kinase